MTVLNTDGTQTMHTDWHSEAVSVMARHTTSRANLGSTIQQLVILNKSPIFPLPPFPH